MGAFDNYNRRAVRAPVNPMDKSTLVSILPYKLVERKPTIFPGLFIIPEGSVEKPGTLVVGPSSWWKEMGEKEPLLEIPVSSFAVADSVVKDYCNSQLAANTIDRKPGIFFVSGEHDAASVKKNFSKELDAAAEKQHQWYLALIKISDTMWARTQGNPLAISNDARHAAIELKLEKPWLQDFKTMQMDQCPACGTLRQNQYPVCANCKTILDIKRFEALGLKVAS